MSLTGVVELCILHGSYSCYRIALGPVFLVSIISDSGIQCVMVYASCRYGFIFIFDGSGMWISAFGTFYG